LVGTVLIRPPQPTSKAFLYRDPSTWSLGQLAVHPDFKGRGVARRLHDVAVELARSHGAQAIALDTAEPAKELIELYQRWGYQIVGSVDWRPHTNYESVLMTRELETGRDLEQIAATFDLRAPIYNQNDWHRRHAERLVELCELRLGESVLDAGTGTGFAALAAARAVGHSGRVLGIDLSSRMLEQARRAGAADGPAQVEFKQGDALVVDWLPAESFDLVICVTALQYMPLVRALRSWRRLLKSGGRLAFSSMCAGSPPAAQIFRECAARFGLQLKDPSAMLGREEACVGALEAAGFTVERVLRESIEFKPIDLAVAWSSNLHSAGHEQALQMPDDAREQLRAEFERELRKAADEDSQRLSRAELLYAVGRR
jgi:ubiquinone/menaquinone biosynthesis C-methylase UbiE